LSALALTVLASCRVARPSELPREPDWIVAVKSARMPDGEPDITHFAHHTWVDVKFGDEKSWERIEVLSATSGVRRFPIGSAVAHADRRWRNRDVRVLGTMAGDEAHRAAEKIRALSDDLSEKYKADYVAWPGPNSNTLLAEIARDTAGLSFPMHHNAVGKDYPGWFGAGLTTSKTGVRVDTLPLGFALGLREGVELHVLQLTFGLSFWPPRLELPFLPEIPWSKGVDAPVVEVPAADQFIVLTDEGWMSLDVGDEGLPERASWLIEYSAADAWVWLEYEWVAPAGAAGQGSLRIHERSSTSQGTGDVTRAVAGSPTGMVLYDADLEGRRVKIVLRRLASGRFMPETELAGP
jgi:hypothetical protein